MGGTLGARGYRKPENNRQRGRDAWNKDAR